jgi:hypothetical protein
MLHQNWVPPRRVFLFAPGAYFKIGFRVTVAVPQGLKPLALDALIGTTKQAAKNS